MADYPSAFVSSDVSSDGIEVGVSDLLKLCRVKDPDTQKRRIENIRRDRIFSVLIRKRLHTEVQPFKDYFLMRIVH